MPERLVLELEDEAICFGCGKPIPSGITDRDDKENLYHHNRICAAIGLYTTTIVNTVELKYKK